MLAASSQPRVDVVFALVGQAVPRDHGYALFGAISRVIGNLHGADWLAVHPIRGVPRPDGLLGLHPLRGSLGLRVVPSEIPRVLPLAGKTLMVAGHPAHVGVSRLYALSPAPQIAARMVVIKGFMEAEPFADAVRRQLRPVPLRAVSAWLIEDFGERGGEDGPLEPVSEALRILLGEDALARGLRDGDAADPERG